MADMEINGRHDASGSDDEVIGHHDDAPLYYNVTSVTPDRHSSFSSGDANDYAEIMKPDPIAVSEDAMYEPENDAANNPPEVHNFDDDDQDQEAEYTLQDGEDYPDIAPVEVEHAADRPEEHYEPKERYEQQQYQQDEEEEVFAAQQEAAPRSVSPAHAPPSVQEDDGYQIHPAFAGIGQTPGLVIWKMELLDPIRLEPKEHGQFFQNSAYVLLNTINVPGVNRFNYEIHFWMGKSASVEECAAASLSTVELDEACLDGRATQHREVQGHESKTFMSYFRQGVRYYKADHAKSHVKQMYQVRGKKNARIEQVDCNFSALNKGDAFVVDNTKDIYVWIGPATTRKERVIGIQFARSLRDDEKAGTAHIHVIEKDWNTNSAFFKVLGKREKEIRAAEDETLLDHIRKDEQGMTLYRIGKKGDTQAIATRPLKQAMLESEHCYVLDGGISGLFAWTGRDTLTDYRTNVWNGVNGFIEQRGYPSWVTVCRIADGSETPLFKQYFHPWVDEYTREYGSAVDQRPPLVRTHSSKVEEWMPDDGTEGETQIWRIDGNKLVPIPDLARGVFFGGDCYIVFYTFDRDGEALGVIYSWQGGNSTVADRMAAASQAVRLDKELGGRSVMVRVALRKEPTHFLRIFGGRVTYYKSGHIKGFRNFRDYDDYDPRSVYMFQVTGTSSEDMRVIEVDARASSLNSNDIFIIYDNKRCYIWIGQYHSSAEAEAAKQIVGQMKVHKMEPEVLKENEESRMFWDVLNGRETYRTARTKVYEGQRFEPRLFHCSFSSGRFVVEEIVAYKQTDLDDDDIFILDTYDEIFTWLGQNTKEHERRDAFKTAKLYLSTDPSGRGSDNTLVAVVRQGYEPPQFVECFDDWDSQFWASRKNFRKSVDDISDENKGIIVKEEETKCTSFFNIEELQRKFPPEGVNVSKKEMYLTDADFEKVFGMSRDAYIVLPGWKKTTIKKQNGLF